MHVPLEVGSIATAATYVNALRTRANGTAVTQGFNVRFHP
jgi:hypothetical protein